jgi:hypothetical protein
MLQTGSYTAVGREAILDVSCVKYEPGDKLVTQRWAAGGQPRCIMYHVLSLGRIPKGVARIPEASRAFLV